MRVWGGGLANRVSFSCMPSIPLRTMYTATAMHAATLSYVLNGYSSRRRLLWCEDTMKGSKKSLYSSLLHHHKY